MAMSKTTLEATIIAKMTADDPLDPSLSANAIAALSASRAKLASWIAMTIDEVLKATIMTTSPSGPGTGTIS
jgi:hypothetical protein